MKFNRHAVILSTALSLVLSTSVLAADLAKGKEVYDKKCAMCHGKDLKGNAAMAKTFKLEPKELSLQASDIGAKSDADLIAVTAKGEKKMPAFEGKLSAEEIANSIAYIRSASPK